MNAIDLSIIMVSWNARDYLLKCLQSIEATTSGLQYEVLVVDNASADGSAQAVRNAYPAVRLIETGSNLGFGRANNLGIRNARGRLLALINSDVELHELCLQGLVSFMDQNPNVGLAGPRLLNGDGSRQVSCRRLPTFWTHLARALFVNTSMADPAVGGAEVCEVQVLAGSFWVARREAVDDVGLLDERFFIYGEDIDWCRRFRDAGWGISYVPSVEAVHYGEGSSSNAPARFSIELHRASLQLWAKYHGRLGAAMYLSIGMLHSGLRVLAYSPLCLIPSRRQRSLTVTSRRNPSSTIRTFSSGVYFRLAATLTCCMKLLVCWVLASAASPLSSLFWDTPSSFHCLVSLLPRRSFCHLPEVFDFSGPFCVPF